MNEYAQLQSDIWDRHEVIWHGEERRTTRGIVPGEDMTIPASVNTNARAVKDAQGTEVLASATVRWSPEYPVPPVGTKLTLPAEFGIKGSRRIITSKLSHSGTGLTPDRVEVTLE